MDTDDPFAPRPKTGGGASAADESPEDLLFAVPEEGESIVKNPYGSDSGFDDAEDFGPCALTDSGSPGPAVNAPTDSESVESLMSFDLDWSADDVREDPAAAALEVESLDPTPAAPRDPVPAKPSDPEPIVAGRPNDRAAEFRPPPAPAPGTPAPTLGAPAPARKKQRSSAGASVMIPGRNRVSYSQGRVSGTKPTVSGRRERSKSSFLAWAVPTWLVLVGGGAGAYLGLVVGSPVLGVVSVTVGGIAALFCRVLLHK